MIRRDGTTPQSHGAITETETEAAVGLAARGSKHDLSFLGAT